MKKTHIFLILTYFLAIHAFSEGIPVLRKAYNMNLVRKLEISVFSENVEFSQTNGNQLIIEVFSTSKKSVPEFTFSEDSLRIFTKDSVKKLAKFNTIKIFIPKFTNEEPLESIKIHTEKGNIFANDIESVFFEAKTSSGNINLSNVNATEFKAFSKNGKITKNNVNFLIDSS